ncbi:hypothetical protein B7494_g6530 [Chlorociboria aeruginascens]|nr:hypothetical protein B7494_g6530 [Chlorociboria aeruginascens]
MRVAFTFILAFVTIGLAMVLPQKSVVVSYPDDTPNNIVTQAMDAIKDAGGVITHEYKFINFPTMSITRKSEAALVKWVNLFPLPNPIDSLDQLSDGVVFWKMLDDLDRESALKSLEHQSSTSWLARKKSLEAFYKSLLRYVRNHCNDLDSLSLETALDFSAIAEHKNYEETVKVATYTTTTQPPLLTNTCTQLLILTLMATVKGSSNTRYIPAMTARLDADSLNEIASIIKETEQRLENVIEKTTLDARLPPPLIDDLDLAIEQQHAELAGDNEKLKKQTADLLTRIERLTDSNETLLAENRRSDEELRVLRSSNNDKETAEYINRLQQKLEETNDVIANQEQQLETDRVTRERHQKELNVLRPSAKRVESLEDQVAELKVENDALSRKANTLDHYQKKLETQSGMEKENANLRRRNDLLEENQKHFDKVHEENETFRTTVQEYKKRFTSYELEVTHLTQHNKALEVQVRALRAEITDLLQKKSHDESFIERLQNDLKRQEQSPTNDHIPLTSNLADELGRSEDADVPQNWDLQISRLKAENQVLKSGNGGTTTAELRVNLESSEQARRRIEEKFQELTEKLAITQEQLRAVISTSSGEKLVVKIETAMKIGPIQILTDWFHRDAAIAKTRTLYLEANEELYKLRYRFAEIEAELSSRDRELLAARADLSAVATQELEAIEDLKKTNEIITSSLENDLIRLQGRCENITTDFNLQKSHLVDALLEKNKYQQQIPILELALAEAQAAAEASANALTKAEERAANGDPKGKKATLEALKEQFESQKTVIDSLERKLKTAEENGPEAQKRTDWVNVKAANETLVKNLTTENALMSTAWYDLTSRLQSNLVVLQRRQDAPRSWLNKQRQMVHASGTPRR